MDEITLSGSYVRLEPLRTEHIGPINDALSHVDRSTFAYAMVPGLANDPSQTAERMVAERLRLRDLGTWIPFVQIRTADDALVGMTNLLAIERWNGPDLPPTSAEIGGTWLVPPAQRSPINTEAKLLMLTLAFEEWGAKRVQIKTDERNDRSRAAITRLGAVFEGILRNYQPGQGELGSGEPRNTAMFSIIDTEWPAVKANLTQRLTAK
jgi:N-acetyltransferase